MASRPIYQFYAELQDYEPKIWRRFQVMDNTSMARLGYILMTLYEMQASHMFRLMVPVRNNAKLVRPQTIAPIFSEPVWRFEVDSPTMFSTESDCSFDAASYQISDILRGIPGEKPTLVYDFGDEWMVEVKLEAVVRDKELPGRALPRVLDGAGYGIIEDCGGAPGLTQLVEAFRRKRGEEYEEYREWLGIDELDLTVFDLDDMNLRLKRVPRIYMDLYEHGKYPSQRSIDFLARKYQQ